MAELLKIVCAGSGALACLLAGSTLAQPVGVAERFGKEVDAQVERHYAGVEGLYKDIHASPELAFEEVNTAKKLAKALRDLGFEVTEGVGKTGVVGLLHNGAGPTIMVRTELDALPMEEKTGLSYASKVKTNYLGKETFVAHSCGHDIHMASWVGTAKTLVALKDRWKGTLMFIAQPAEEVLGGAKAMLDDGLFKRFGKPDVALALHDWPMAYGTIAYNSGPFTSNGDTLEITFKGRGGHGAAPDRSIDPIVEAARFVEDVQTVVSREKDMFEFGVITIGAIQGGTSGNIIPASVTLRGTIRSYDSEVREKLHEGVRRTAHAVAAMANAPEPEVKITTEADAVVNNAALVDRVVPVLKAAFGDAHVQRMRPIPPSEDFSEYGKAGVPEMFFLIGMDDPKDVEAARQPGGKPLPFNHSPFFAPVPEPSIKTGIKAMSLAVLAALQR
jgi:hippurate hydrolase